MQSKVKILGHALHPMLVPFPIAFNTATLACYITYVITTNDFWFKVGFTANCAAIVTSIVAMLPGLIDWLSIPQITDAKSTGLKHMVANIFTLGFFVASAAINYQNLNTTQPPVQTALILTAIGFLLMLYAGFKGWEMVQKHHIGIDNPSTQELIEATTPEKNANEIFTAVVNRPKEKK